VHRDILKVSGWMRVGEIINQYSTQADMPHMFVGTATPFLLAEDMVRPQGKVLMIGAHPLMENEQVPDEAKENELQVNCAVTIAPGAGITYYCWYDMVVVYYGQPIRNDIEPMQYLMDHFSHSSGGGLNHDPTLDRHCVNTPHVTNIPYGNAITGFKLLERRYFSKNKMSDTDAQPEGADKRFGALLLLSAARFKAENYVVKRKIIDDRGGKKRRVY